MTREQIDSIDREMQDRFNGGYIAALEAVKAKIKERCDIIDEQTEGCDGDAFIAILGKNEEFGRLLRWLDQQLEQAKETP